MLKKLIYTAILSSAFASQAMAANPSYCNKYANAAVGQYFQATQKYPQCAGGISGMRWMPDFQAHYNWCISADPAAVQHEWDQRGQYLYMCSRNM